MAAPAVTVPASITVHLGAPSAPAANITVSYTGYIKNVACSELYPTWPEEALKANIFAIQSFTLNRVYTEHYRARGYDFDITSSSSYDQAFVPGREIFGVINSLVDNSFTTYIVWDDHVQPLAARYCSGLSAMCQGLSQWGSVNLARRGMTDIDILRYYYGEEIFLRTASMEETIPSYPGVPLGLGFIGEGVRVIQRQLNRISMNYPAIPRVAVNEGIFNGATEKAVIAFQQIFNLKVDGIVGKATWYKLKQIYNSVKRLAEIYSEGLLAGEVERAFSGVYKRGDSDIIVEIMQYYLDFFGRFNSSLPRVKITGTFDAETEAAVKAFQEYYGLPADGIVRRETRNKMLTEYRAVVESLPRGYMTFSPPLYPGFCITSGTSGAIVTQIQNFLRVIAQNDSRVPLVEADGQYGPKTAAAVKAVQEISGILPVGEVCPLTWSAITELYSEYQ